MQGKNGKSMQGKIGWKLRTTGISLVVALMVPLAACDSSGGDGGSGDGNTVRVAFIPGGTTLPVLIAEQKGIFAKNGLNVELHPTNNLSALPTLVGKQFDIALTTPPDLLKAASRGINVVGISGLAFNTPEAPQGQIMVRSDSGIVGPADLEGKTLGAGATGSVIHLSALKWLEDAGVEPGSVKVNTIDQSATTDQLKAGRIDAGEYVSQFAAAAEATGMKSIGDPVASVSDRALFSFWLADQGWAEENSDKGEAYRKSLEEAIDYIEGNKDEALEVLSNETKLPLDIVKKVPLPAFDTRLKPSDLEAWEEPLERYGEGNVQIDVNPDDLVVADADQD